MARLPTGIKYMQVADLKRLLENLDDDLYVTAYTLAQTGNLVVYSTPECELTDMVGIIDFGNEEYVKTNTNQ